MNDNYGTPKDFKERIEKEEGIKFDGFDPFSLNSKGLREYDNLGDWPNNLKYVLANGPYSDPVPWLRRCIKESQKGVTVYALVRGDTSTAWWHELVMPFVRPEDIRFVRGRIKFYDPTKKEQTEAKFASILVIYRPLAPTIETAAQVMRPIIA